MTNKNRALPNAAHADGSLSLKISARVVLRTSVVASLGVLLANCASQPQQARYSSQQQREIGAFASKKYGTASPRMYADNGAEIPKGGGRDHTGKTYRVAGRSYTPHDRAVGSAQVGNASWYGAAFHGRKTANGEIYDRRSFSAAHPTMPLPSYARVTNVRNGASVIVRVNDRGPYHGGRIMDVSERVADSLAFKSQGTGRVRVEYLGRASLAGSDDKKLAQSLSVGAPAVASYIPTSYSVNSGTQVAMAVEPVASAPPMAAAAYSPRVQPAAATPLPTETTPAVDADEDVTKTVSAKTVAARGAYKADASKAGAAAAQKATVLSARAKPQPVDEARGVKGLAMNSADKASLAASAAKTSPAARTAAVAAKSATRPVDLKASAASAKSVAGRKPETVSAFAPAKAKSGKFDLNNPLAKLAPKKADTAKSKVLSAAAGD